MLCMTQDAALLTTAEVAEALAVSDETIHRWARQGKLRFIVLPSGLKRFKREDVDAILSGTASEATK